MTRVRNMGRILSAFLMLGISSMCGAQIYKYLGIEDGLSNRRIYRIQKGRSHLQAAGSKQRCFYADQPLRSGYE